jgi:hypothetical protein
MGETTEREEVVAKLIAAAKLFGQVAADVQSGKIDVADLPKLPDLSIGPIERVPSPDVAQAVAQTAAARDKLAKETTAKVVLAQILRLAEYAGTLVPLLAAVLSLVLFIAPLAGCDTASTVAPGAVQVGPASGPMFTASMPVDVEQAGVGNAQFKAQGEASMGSGNNVAAPQSNPTSQGNSASGAGSGNQAGRDNDSRTLQLNLNGSGWPLVIVVVVAFATAAAWQRASAGRAEARDERGRADASANDAFEIARRREEDIKRLAAAVRDMGPGPQRDRLLEAVQKYFGVDAGSRASFDKLLRDAGLYVTRSTKPEDVAA